MALVLTNEQNYENIANSIRAKNGTTETYTPEQMSAAIDAISVGGGGGDMFKANYATQSDTKVDTALNAEALGGTPASEFVLDADFDALSKKVDEMSISDVSGQIVEHNENELAHQDIRNAIPTKTSELTNDSGFITDYTETDPTVPAWAKASSKPTYTASEVGAVAIGEDGKIPSEYLPEMDYAPSDHTHTPSDIGAASSSHGHDVSDITGTLPVANGGTGRTTITPSVSTKALRAISAGTSDLVAGSSYLQTGAIYLVYE